MGDTTGSSGGPALKASIAGGDSGGPLIVGGAVIGVLNGGFPGTGGSLSQYGDRSIWAPLSETSNQAFLISQGVVAVPEPSAAALPFLALGAYLPRRPRHQARSRLNERRFPSHHCHLPAFGRGASDGLRRLL